MGILRLGLLQDGDTGVLVVFGGEEILLGAAAGAKPRMSSATRPVANS